MTIEGGRLRVEVDAPKQVEYFLGFEPSPRERYLIDQAVDGWLESLGPEYASLRMNPDHWGLLPTQRRPIPDQAIVIGRNH